MDRLPKVFRNDINKNINNNKEVFYSLKSDDRSFSPGTNNVDMEIKKIFNDVNYSFNIPVIIKTNDKTYETTLIYRDDNYIVTMDKDTIPIKSIISLQKKSI